MKHWMMLFIASCFLISRTQAETKCGGCHAGYDRILTQSMGARMSEKKFVAQSLEKNDPRFWDKKCASCHLRSCEDCHTRKNKKILRPGLAECSRCHSGYFVGADYQGLAPREENLRFQRGLEKNGKNYLAMAPDIHFERGLVCGDCHSMRSLIEGKKSSKTCLDCHEAKPSILEHRIPGHLEKMECYACHSAWGAQEYGTWFLRFDKKSPQDAFELAEADDEYVKSSGPKSQAEPPLGLNERGRVSPIRPQFIVNTSRFFSGKIQGQENERLASRWKPWFPHTIRRAAGGCESCHGNSARYVLAAGRAGMVFDSGGFLPMDRVESLNMKSKAYQRGVVEKWKSILHRVDASSR